MSVELRSAIEALKQARLEELLDQCTQPQRDFFYKLYPEGPSPDQFWNALDQCERTIVKNRARGESDD